MKCQDLFSGKNINLSAAELAQRDKGLSIQNLNIQMFFMKQCEWLQQCKNYAPFFFFFFFFFFFCKLIGATLRIPQSISKVGIGFASKILKCISVFKNFM